MSELVNAASSNTTTSLWLSHFTRIWSTLDRIPSTALHTIVQSLFLVHF